MSSASLLHRVFVYGTLKTTQPNHDILKEASNGIAKFIGKAVTEKAYPLVVASSSNIPFLLPIEGKGKNIHGEVYSIDDKMLEFLDDFESHPTLYKRQKIPVSLGDKSELCWCYLLQKSKPELLQLPFLESYDNNDPQVLKYVIRYKRTKPFGPEVQLK